MNLCAWCASLRGVLLFLLKTSAMPYLPGLCPVCGKLTSVSLGGIVLYRLGCARFRDVFVS
jgi:hypothetical protein